jgi:hypothetical protein
MSSPQIASFRGPHAGAVAIAFVTLFCAGLFPVTAFGGMPYFPPPTASVSEMVAFFSTRQSAVLICAFLQFGAAIPLGIFTATVVSQLQFLGVRAAGTNIALFGGLASAFGVLFGNSFLWAMTYPGIAQDSTLVHALYRVSFGIGGPGFSVPFGILIAGVSVSAGLSRLIPRWLMYFGIAVAICGELSWFEILNVKFLPLIPLTRFPGFVWSIIVGFRLPRRISTESGK